MNAVKRELTNRGILFKANDEDMWRGPEYDTDAYLVDITDKFVITITYSAVLPETLRIYERKTLKPIGEQELYPDITFWGKSRTWNSHGYVEVAE